MPPALPRPLLVAVRPRGLPRAYPGPTRPTRLASRGSGKRDMRMRRPPAICFHTCLGKAVRSEIAARPTPRPDRFRRSHYPSLVGAPVVTILNWFSEAVPTKEEVVGLTYINHDGQIG